MWGETTLPSLMPFDNTAINIEVMRAAARADISKRLNAGSRPFTVSSVAIYHANNRIQVMPNPSALDPGDPNRVVTASIPTYAEPMTTPVVFSVTDNNVDQTYAGAIYVPESLPAATAADRVDATCLVVGGAYTYADGTSKTLYYRVDFNSGAPGHPFGQVLRNTRYNFVITSVTAPGKETPDEAASSTDTSMTVAVTNWDENYSQVAFVSNVDYMMLDASHIVMPSTAGATKTFRLRLTTPLAPDLRYTMAAATYGDPPHNTIFISQYYTVSRDAGTLVGDYYEFVFTVTTNSANTDPLDMRPDEVVFTARGASLPITIVQDAFLADDPGKSRKINVLSLTGGEGSMGTYYPGGTANTAGTAANMRSILTNASYFGPGGIVDFPGFTFEQFSTTDISSATTVSTDQLRRALDVTDILIMPYGSDPNPTIVGIINQWRTDPRHVLFMSADAGLATGSDGTVGIATNVNMWNSLNDGLTWYPESVLRDSQGLLDLVVDLLSDVLTIVLNIVTTTTVQIDGATVSNPTTANSPFTGGAFGQPNMSQLGSDSGAYQLWDYTSEWAVPADGSSFQPLMVYQVTAVQKLIIGLIETGRTTTKSNMTLMGVDPTTRIVYFGETQLMTDFMGATPGANSNSTLMCNTWAWAVDTVLGR
jgi:hypothetical protein